MSRIRNKLPDEDIEILKPYQKTFIVFLLVIGILAVFTNLIFGKTTGLTEVDTSNYIHYTGTTSGSGSSSDAILKSININTATAKDLERLKGIGPSKAKSIISYREENGTFEKPEDIMNVKGIGEKIYENIKDDITVR